MTFLLYATIWSALLLFVAGEASKRGLVRASPAAARAWRAWTLGAALCVIHMLLAFEVRHGWSQRAAVVETSRRTAELFGSAWDGALYVNYVFASVWLLEAAWWRVAPASYLGRPRALTWLLRSFYALVIVNAAIVFASPAGRVAGVTLVIALVWTWRPARRVSGPGSIGPA